MRFETLSALTAINRRWPSEYGKIIQTILAISFGKRRAGYSVENRLSEGVDLEITRGAEKFAVEVKTTEGFSITLGEKDILGLRAKSRVDSYIPAVAALRMQISSDWVIANAANLQAGEYSPAKLSLDSIAELESLANIHFAGAIMELSDKVLSPPRGSPLDYLLSVLAAESR